MRLRGAPVASASALRGWQWVEPQLGVVGLAAPALLIFGTVVDEEHNAGRRQAVDQAVQERLRLGVDPVQVLDDQEQGLHLTRPQQQALAGIQGALAALGRIKGLPVAYRQLGRPGAPGTAGRMGARPSSSVRSLPMTLSRIVCGSSRASSWK